MQAVPYSEKRSRQRKMLLLLPLLILPFLTLLFWAIGGGKSGAVTGKNKSSSGLNTLLPDAKIKSEQGLDKLSFYQQAVKDSVKLVEERKTDPYWQQFSNQKDSALASSNPLSAHQNGYDPLPDNVGDVGANEAKVYSKLQQLNKALADARRSNVPKDNLFSNQYAPVNGSVYDSRVEQLRAMMNRIKENKAPDPELAQLNQMLDKIAAIQHPELVKDTLLNNDPDIQEHSLTVHQKDPQLAVSTLLVPAPVNNHHPAAPALITAFYAESHSMAVEDTIVSNNAFPAMIAETQTLVSGATVKLSLTLDLLIQGKTVPAGSYIYGTVTLRNERLLISIPSIRLDNNIFPVSLMAYDLDGQEGIYIPGSISANTVKQSADRATSSMGTSLFNPSLGAQAASAGIQTAKALLHQKVKGVKVTVPAGYQVLLKDMHTIH